LASAADASAHDAAMIEAANGYGDWRWLMFCFLPRDAPPALVVLLFVARIPLLR
jgi:hypothetical protein